MTELTGNAANRGSGARNEVTRAKESGQRGARGNNVSHRLIEEFMLLANEAVATRLMGQHTNALYRVHEKPDERRLQEYRDEVLQRTRGIFGATPGPQSRV